jgi:hypothetical protein
MTSSYKPRIVVPRPQLASFAGNIKGSPSMRVMRLALDQIAAERHGSVTEGYTDCAGKFHRTIFGLKTPSVPRGIGVDIEPGSGRVVFRYDGRGANVAETEAICRDLARAYAVVAVLQAQKKLGYNVKVETDTPAVGGHRVITSAIRT